MGMMDVAEMKRLLLVKPFEFAAALAALLGVLTFGILPGVFIGVGLSILWLVAVSALPYIPELGRKPGTDAFFDLDQHRGLRDLPRPAHSALRRRPLLRQRRRPGRSPATDSRSVDRRACSGVILSMEGVNFIDTEGADVLKAIARAGTDHDIDLHLARAKPQVVQVLERSGFFDLVSRDHIHDDIEAAVRLHTQRHPAPSNS